MFCYSYTRIRIDGIVPIECTLSYKVSIGSTDIGMGAKLNQSEGRDFENPLVYALNYEVSGLW